MGTDFLFVSFFRVLRVFSGQAFISKPRINEVTLDLRPLLFRGFFVWVRVIVCLHCDEVSVIWCELVFQPACECLEPLTHTKQHEQTQDTKPEGFKS